MKVDGLLLYYCKDKCPPTERGWQVAFEWDVSDRVIHRVRREETLCPTCKKEGRDVYGYTQVIFRPRGSSIEYKEEDRLDNLEQKGVIKRGSGNIPPNFWWLPRPEDPDGSVRKAAEEE